MKTQTLAHDNLNQLYKRVIIQHARNPQNFGKLGKESILSEGINPLCGDKIKIYVNLNQNNVIQKICFEGTGCAISIASTSILTSALEHQESNKAIKYAENLIRNLHNDSELSINSIIDLDEIKALEGVKDFPSRIKCATLGWQTFLSSFNDNNIVTTTE